MNEHQELAATFVEFLLGAFDLKMGGTQVSGGETSAKGGKIDLKPDKAGGGMKVHGTVGSVKTENVNGSMGK
jgi:hypothetical protein